MNIEKKLEEYKQYFQENTLDGNDILDCGGSLIEASFIFDLSKEFLRQALTEQRQELIKKIEQLPTGLFDSTPYKNDLINLIKKQDES